MVLKRRNLIKISAPNYTFIVLLFVLVVFGLVILASASSDLAKMRYGDSFYYLKHQIFSGLIPGIIGFLFSFFVGYKFWQRISLPLLFVTIILLLLTLTPLGLKFYGSQRWLAIGSFSFQPSEIAKLAVLIYISAWLGKHKKNKKSFKENTLPFMIILSAVVIPIFLQPSTTTALIIILSSLAMYLISGMDIKSLIFMFLIFLAGVALLIITTPYRLERIMSFSNPEKDVLGKNYHINQSLMALGNGGLLGVGYGKSTTKIFYLPEPMGDSIFAVLAEELGFVGACFLIALFLMLIWQGLKISKKAPDAFANNFVVGSVTMIGIQAAIHIAAVSGLGPYTGVPLPFISYGGTSLAVFLTIGGIIANISKY